MFIFVDDIRTTTNKKWINARTPDEAIKLIDTAVENKEEIHISFDHDLGGELTSRSIVNYMLYNGITPTTANVHSANPVGAQWLETALNRDFGHPIPKIEIPHWI